MVKKISLIVFLLFSYSCQLKTIKDIQAEKNKNKFEEIRQQNPQPPIMTEVLEQKNEETKDITPEPINSTVFGIIFSGGGVKTWSYVNLLKEIQKYKIPIAAVAGTEWGAVVAGIYAQNQSANEVEWELSKFKDLDSWQDFIKKIFEKKSIMSSKIPFACTSLNLKNQTAYVLNKGLLDTVVPFCLPSAGIMKPYQQSISDMSDVGLLASYLRSQGANKVILIHPFSQKSNKPLIGTFDSLENQIWSLSVANLNKKSNHIDEIITLDLPQIPLNRFDLRRDVLNSSINSAKSQLSQIVKKYNF